MKHTPGPWGYSRTHLRSPDYWYVITDPDGRGPIVDVGGRDLVGQIAEAKHLITDHKEIEANARLIAAAPDLLNALKWISTQSDWQGGKWGDVELIRHAIEKAEGTTSQRGEGGVMTSTDERVTDEWLNEAIEYWECTTHSTGRKILLALLELKQRRDENKAKEG